MTAQVELFEQAVKLGEEVIRLHTYNRRFTTGNPGQTPTVPAGNNPPTEAPNQGALDKAKALSHDPQTSTLLVHGTDAAGNPHQITISNVTADMYNYTTGTMNVLASWFKYRKASPYRRKPPPGKPPSPLDNINQTQWDSSPYPEQLLELLHVLRLLTDLHTGPTNPPDQNRRRPAGHLHTVASGRERGETEARGQTPADLQRAAATSIPRNR